MLQIPFLSASPCAIVVVWRLFGREVSRDMYEICWNEGGAPIQPVRSNSFAQQVMGKKGVCSGRAPARSLDMPEAHIQAQMLGNSAGFISVGIAWDKGVIAFHSYSAQNRGMITKCLWNTCHQAWHSLLPANKQKQVITLTSKSARSVRYWQRVMLGKERRSWGHRQEGGKKYFLIYRKKK